MPHARRSDDDETMDTITTLAEEISRAAPDVADKALRIADLARLAAARPDRNAVLDALDAQQPLADLSEARLQVATSAVMAAVTKPGRDEV